MDGWTDNQMVKNHKQKKKGSFNVFLPQQWMRDKGVGLPQQWMRDKCVRLPQQWMRDKGVRLRMLLQIQLYCRMDGQTIKWLGH